MGRRGVQKELLSDWVEHGGGEKGEGKWSQRGWCPEGQLGCLMPGKAHLHGASGDGERPLGALPLPTGPLGATVVSGLVLHPLRPPPTCLSPGSMRERWGERPELDWKGLWWGGLEDWWKRLAFSWPLGPGAPAEVPSLIVYPWRPKTLQGCPLGCTEPKPHSAPPARAFSGFLFYFCYFGSVLLSGSCFTDMFIFSNIPVSFLNLLYFF